MKTHPLLALMLIASLTDEQMRQLAEAQAKARRCTCATEVKARQERQETTPGVCWNCGKPTGTETTP